MKVGSASGAGLAGLGRAEAQFERAAQQLALPVDQVSIGQRDPTIDGLTGLMSASHAFRANLKVIQSAEQMNDDLLRLLTR